MVEHSLSRPPELTLRTTQPIGEASSLEFSDVKEIFAYIPQVKIVQGSFPLLVCDVSKLDLELLGWNDPYLGIDAHCVLLDIPGLIEKPIFSKVHHWPRPKGENMEVVEEPRNQPRESILGRLFPFLT